MYMGVGRLYIFGFPLVRSSSMCIRGASEGCPYNRLMTVCQSIHSQKSWSKQISQIDHLYGQILYSIFQPLTDEEQQTYQVVLGALLSLKNPLSLQGLQELLSFHVDMRKPWLVKAAVQAFQCVLAEIEDEKPLRFHHQSFYDFFKDGTSRSVAAIRSVSGQQKDICTVDILKESANLCLASLQMMNTQLHFNIGKVQSSFQFNEELPDLDVSPALSYSCQYWTLHLEDLTPGEMLEQQVLEAGKRFLNEKFLYWLEVMSRQNSMRIVAGLLLALSRKFKVGHHRF